MYGMVATWLVRNALSWNIRYFVAMYLARLFRNSRTMGIAAVVLLAGQLFFSWKGVATFPFFLYGMYTGPMHPDRKVEVFELQVAEGRIDWKHRARSANDYWQYNIAHYARIRGLGADPVLETLRSRMGGSSPEWMIERMINEEDRLRNFETRLNEEFGASAGKIRLLKHRLGREGHISTDTLIDGSERVIPD